MGKSFSRIFRHIKAGYAPDFDGSQASVSSDVYLHLCTNQPEVLFQVSPEIPRQEELPAESLGARAVQKRTG